MSEFDSKFKKGRVKTAGRKAGTPNKKTVLRREILSSHIDDVKELGTLLVKHALLTQRNTCDLNEGKTTKRIPHPMPEKEISNIFFSFKDSLPEDFKYDDIVDIGKTKDDEQNDGTLNVGEGENEKNDDSATII